MSSPQPAKDLETIHPGHHEIEDDELRGRIPDELQRRFAIRTFEGLETFTTQVRDDDFAYCGVVIDDENASHLSSVRGSRTVIRSINLSVP